MPHHPHPPIPLPHPYRWATALEAVINKIKHAVPVSTNPIFFITQYLLINYEMFFTPADSINTC